MHRTPPRLPAALLVALSAAAMCACHDVDVERPSSGRPLSNEELREVQRVADAAFRDARGVLPGLPSRLTLIVRWGKDVIPETGETATAAAPQNVMVTLDPDRDVLATIRAWLRPALLHELHHLARGRRVPSTTLVDRVVTEGLATAFERDLGRIDPPWGRPPPEIEAWTREILAQPDTAEWGPWLHRHPDGRRWIGMRVGTFLVDRVTRATGRTAADLVFASTGEILRGADDD